MKKSNTGRGMKKLYHFIPYSLLLLQGCMYNYKPSMQNVPMFREKNEMRINIGYKNYQLAYAPSNHIGIMINGHYDWAEKFGWGWSEENRIYFVEGGAGYYSLLKKNMMVELYGGGGKGELYHTESPGSRSAYALETTRYFIQPGIGKTVGIGKIDNIFEFAFSSRFICQKFSGLHPLTTSSSRAKELDGSLFMFIEPAFTFRIGAKRIKYHMQTVVSHKLSPGSLDHLQLAFNIGCNIRLDRSLWSKNKSRQAEAQATTDH